MVSIYLRRFPTHKEMVALLKRLSPRTLTALISPRPSRIVVMIKLDGGDDARADIGAAPLVRTAPKDLPIAKSECCMRVFSAACWADGTARLPPRSTRKPPPRTLLFPLPETP